MSDERRNLLPTPTTLDNVEKRTTHAGGNLTLQGALCGVNPVDAERHLMPSPRASDGQGGPDPADRRYDRDDVEGRLRRDGVIPNRDLMPTPSASDGGEGSHLNRGGDRQGELLLPGIARQIGEQTRAGLMPTPTSSDGSGGGCRTNLSWENTTKSTGEGGASRLRDVVGLLGDDKQNLLPTPMAHDFIPNTEAEMNRKSPRLNAIGGLLPTPAARDGLPAKTEETMRRQRDRGYGPNLNDVAANYLPTPKARDWTGHGPADMRRNSPDLSAISRILPTPRASDAKGTDTPSEHARNSPGLGAVGHLLSEEPVDELHPDQEPVADPEKLLPTPSASDGIGGGPNNPQNRIDNGHHVQLVDLGMSRTVWGKYEAAIRCWERMTRPAPAPTEVNKNGNPRLAAGFSEWLMGWPAGHVTDPEIGISRNDQLRITGNGVVPQQAAHALRTLLRVAWDNQ